MRPVVPLLLGLLLGACTASHSASKAPPAAVPSASPTSVSVTREFDITLHVDSSFNEAGRTVIRSAAARWRHLTQDRVRIALEFDLDFDDVIGLKAHGDARHSLLIGVMSDSELVARLDAMLGGPNAKPLAATRAPEAGPIVVWPILDRIPALDAEAVITHEFGHVIGLPDLPSFGSIMSGAQIKGERAATEFSDEDVALCRAAHYCR